MERKLKDSIESGAMKDMVLKIRELELSERVTNSSAYIIASQIGYEEKKFGSTQKTGVKHDETAEDRKWSTNIKDTYKPLAGWRKKTLADLIESSAMNDAGAEIQDLEL